jgi:quercetin dioxygenase-like cupin family protein
MYPLPSVAIDAREQPVERIEFVGGFYFRSLVLEAGKVVGQHEHDHDHVSFVGWGRCAAGRTAPGWATRSGGEGFFVEKGSTHCYQALEQSLLACVHNEASALSITEKGI